MKDLLTLDGIVASQESRPLRKAQVGYGLGWKAYINKVTAIQHMIDDVDTIQKKLRTLSEGLPKIEENLKEEEKEEVKKETDERLEEQNEEGLVYLCRWVT